MATLTDPALDDRIQSVPRELQDIILNFTVAVKPDQTIVINSKHKAPWQLQINRAIRKRQAPIYFGTSKFQSKLSTFINCTFNKWLRAQSSAHLGMITTIRYDSEQDQKILEVMARRHGWARCYNVGFDMVESMLNIATARHLIAVLEVNVRVKQADGEIKEVWAKKGDVQKVLAEGQ